MKIFGSMRRSLWFGLGAAAILASGCASAGHPTVMTAQQIRPGVAPPSATSDISVESFKCPAAASSNNCPTMFGTVRTANISPTTVEIRRGGPGEVGPPVVALTRTGADTWQVPAGTPLTESQYSDYLAGRMYVAMYDPTGPIDFRGQIRP